MGQYLKYRGEKLVLTDRQEHCRNCSTDKEKYMMKKVVVYKPRGKKEVYFKCYECGVTFKRENLRKPHKPR